MKYATITLIGFLLASCQSITKSSQPDQKPFKYANQVASLADAFLTDTLMNALSIGIYYKGDEFIRHYGELDPGQNNIPSDKTIYDIGSVTKTFVGTLVANALQESRLSIDDDIRSYLDGEYSNLQFKNEAIKIKHLITHTGRLPRYLPESTIDEFQVIDASLPIRMSQIKQNYSKSQFLKI